MFELEKAGAAEPQRAASGFVYSFGEIHEYYVLETIFIEYNGPASVETALFRDQRLRLTQLNCSQQTIETTRIGYRSPLACLTECIVQQDKKKLEEKLKEVCQKGELRDAVGWSQSQIPDDNYFSIQDPTICLIL